MHKQTLLLQNILLWRAYARLPGIERGKKPDDKWQSTVVCCHHFKISWDAIYRRPGGSSGTHVDNKLLVCLPTCLFVCFNKVFVCHWLLMGTLYKVISHDEDMKSKCHISHIFRINYIFGKIKTLCYINFKNWYNNCIIIFQKKSFVQEMLTLKGAGFFSC